MAVNTLIRPKVEYSSAVWDPYTKENIDKIERVQRRAARYVYNNYDYSSSVTTMLENLKWQPLEERRMNTINVLTAIALVCCGAFLMFLLSMPWA
jgi:hypothetical protein